MKRMTSKQEQLRNLGISSARELAQIERENRRKYKKAINYFQNFSVVLLLTVLTLLVCSL